MRQQKTIQRFLAALLLLLFTVSILPKSYFHDVIANHTDAVSCEHPLLNLTCVHPQDFHCSFNDLVVAAPYTPAAPQYIFLSLYKVLRQQPALVPAYTQMLCFGTDSRGPPRNSALFF